MKKFLCLVILFNYYIFNAYSEINEIDKNYLTNGYKLSTISSFISSNTAPLWQTANKNGIIPDENSFITEYELYKSFHNKNGIFKANLGVDIITSFSNYKNRFFPSQFYADLQYHTFFLCLGLRNEKTKYNGLSSTNGEIQWSNNARSLPGYSIGLTKYFDAWDALNLAFNISEDKNRTLKYIFQNTAFNFNFGDYIVNDNRFNGDKTLMHKDMFGIKLSQIKNLDISASLNRIVYWAGESKLYGKQPSGLGNYKRVLFSEHGDSSALDGDQINRLGNALGAYNFEIKYHLNSNREIALYYSHPFEDKSGLQFQNRTDGVWGFYFKNGLSKLFSHFVYEYINTKNQGGITDKIFTEDGEAKGIGGNDNYFNNGVYISGHTYYKRTVGSPLLYPIPSENGDICRGIKNNKFSGNHFGIDGNVYDMPYKVLFTNTHNLGRNRDAFDAHDYHYSAQLDIAQKLKFLDSIFKCNIIKNHKLNFILGANYSKYGESFFSDNAWGEFVKISFNGSFNGKDY